MQKIISLFQRNYDGDRLVRDEVVPGAEWVINGEGIATRKWDGTCCKIENGILYKRYDAKNGKTPPTGFIPAQDPDPVTGHWPGWIEVSATAKEDKWFRQALEGYGDVGAEFEDGTYELCGPRINGNPERLEKHILIRHGHHPIEDLPRTFYHIGSFLSVAGIEGIVWHHPDGRMVKIKAKDFGIKRAR
ncbi:MAG TPA: DUF5565 family protein [Puia sp.]|nr:DUF5565 family protein [Puia sp.]